MGIHGQRITIATFPFGIAYLSQNYMDLSMHQVVILAAKRTAIGSFLGSLSNFSPAELGEKTSVAAIIQSKIPADQIEHAVFGHIITTSAKDVYLARDIALRSGLREESSAFNVNRLCGSGLQAIISASQMLQLGNYETALCGGAEVMSQGALILPNMRKGLRIGHKPITDLTLGILTDPFGSGAMGCTAEVIAKKYQLSRQELDEFALLSQQKALNAHQKGYFSNQIVPIDVSTQLFMHDEHPKPTMTMEELARLKPAFQPDGIVTPGNSSGLNDGAASVVLATSAFASAHGLQPLARIVDYSFAGVSPELMGLGPIPAVQKLLKNQNLDISDISVIESNEAFAAQAIAVAKSLNLPTARTNPNGGAIALGHPVGATGAVLVTKVIYELLRTEQRLGLITMCIGGGQGIALLIEVNH